MKKGLLTAEEWLAQPGIPIDEIAIQMQMVKSIEQFRNEHGRLLFHNDSDEQSFAE